MKYNLKPQLKVDGKMNETDAGRVGNKLANAVVIFAACFGAAALIYAVRWW